MIQLGKLVFGCNGLLAKRNVASYIGFFLPTALGAGAGRWRAGRLWIRGFAQILLPIPFFFFGYGFGAPNVAFISEPFARAPGFPPLRQRLPHIIYNIENPRSTGVAPGPFAARAAYKWIVI